MLQFLEKLFLAIQYYVETTPLDQMAAHALFAVGWIPIAGVVVWGLIQLWIDARQGKYAGTFRWQLLRVDVPQDSIQTPKGMENFFTNLAGSKSSITWKEQWLLGKFQTWFSLEIVSVGGQITFYIRTSTKYRDIVEAAMYAQYPEAQITEVEDYVEMLPDDYPNDNWDVWGSEMKLKKPDHIPLRSWMDFEHQGEKDQRFKDPLLTMLEGLGKMAPGEVYWLQILIMQPNSQDWIKAGKKEIEKIYGITEKPKKSMLSDTVGWIPGEIARQVTGGDLLGGGGDEKKQDDFAAFKITTLQKDQVDATARKISKIGWYTKIRFVYGAKPELYRKGTIASMTKGIFHQYGHLGWNSFAIHGPATPKDDYFWQEWQIDQKKKELVSRFKSRSMGTGANLFILNCEELATIFHFPAADARTPVLTSLGSRRSEAPMELKFAGVGDPDLPNIDRAASNFGDVVGSGSVSRPVARKMATPTLTPPTARVADTTGSNTVIDSAPSVESAHPVFAQVEERGMPQPGMPAPLPPGLDLADEPIDGSSPDNLPVE